MLRSDSMTPSHLYLFDTANLALDPCSASFPDSATPARDDLKIHLNMDSNFVYIHQWSLILHLHRTLSRR